MDAATVATVAVAVIGSLQALMTGVLKVGLTKHAELQNLRDKAFAGVLERSTEALKESSASNRKAIGALTLAAERDKRQADAAYVQIASVDQLVIAVGQIIRAVEVLSSEVHDKTTESRATRHAYDTLADECRRLVEIVKNHISQEEAAFREILSGLPK